MNICKVRSFPEWEYFVYDLSKDERGRWLNIWFKGSDWVNPKKGQHPRIVPRNEYWTLKKVDKDTANHLYNREYNPISIGIIQAYRKDKKTPFDMKAQIHSVDDSSYGIWFQDKELTELEAIRLKIMQWLEGQPNGVNGEEFLNICESLGGVHKDYD